MEFPEKTGEVTTAEEHLTSSYQDSGGYDRGKGNEHVKWEKKNYGHLLKRRVPFKADFAKPWVGRKKKDSGEQRRLELLPKNRDQGEHQREKRISNLERGGVSICKRVRDSNIRWGVLNL